MLKRRFLLCLFLTTLIITGCAKRGTITGGAKDTIPPAITSSNPPNMSTGFSGSQIRINFSEYIKIKDVSKQLIISPPMATPPDIIPTGSASKYINIRIKDTLQPNTTYSFNFGQSITDNNEGNPYSQFKFIFSTGTYIDSLTLNGSIKDAHDKKPDNFVNVMLYEANETFNDSTIYKERPRYVTNTLDSMVNYSLQNLKEGRYYIVALKDKSNNYRYDPKTDKIAFIKEPITIPTDTIYQLELFKEQAAFKGLKPSQASSHRLLAGYEGDPRGLRIKVQNGQDSIRTLVTQLPVKDSVQIWLPRNIKADSLQVNVAKNDFTKDFNVKFKDMKAIDSLTVNPVQKGTLNFRDKFTLLSSTPITAIDESKITLRDKDSVAVKYTYTYNEFDQKLEFDFTKAESQQYTFTLLPGALKDFYEKENDTLAYKLSTRSLENYGNLRISLQNVNRFPVIIELTNAKGDTQASYYSEKETEIVFDAILPDKYTVRAIYDDNRNKEWDSGNYLEKRQPEEVIYYTDGKDNELDVRESWDVLQVFNLGG